MKVSLCDLEKSLEWIKNNTHAVAVKISVEHNRFFKLYAEDKHARIIEITLYSVDGSQNSLMKPTIKKTEQL